VFCIATPSASLLAACPGNVGSLSTIGVAGCRTFAIFKGWANACVDMLRSNLLPTHDKTSEIVRAEN